MLEKRKCYATRRLKGKKLQSIRLAKPVKVFRMNMYGFKFYAVFYRFAKTTPHFEFRSYDGKAFFISETGYRSHFIGMVKTPEDLAIMIRSTRKHEVEQLINRVFEENISKIKNVSKTQLSLF